MEIAEFFKTMESEYRSAAPWPWPCSMTEEELNFWQSVWPEHAFTQGAYIGGTAALRFEGGAIEVDLGSVTYGDAQPESVG